MPQISLRNGNPWKIFWTITCTEIDQEGGVVARPLVRQPPYRQNMGETPKQFQSWTYWPNMGENLTQVKSPPGKQYWKWYSHKNTAIGETFCILLVKNRLEAQIFSVYIHIYGTSFIWKIAALLHCRSLARQHKLLKMSKSSSFGGK